MAGGPAVSAVLARGPGEGGTAAAPYPVAFDLDTRFGRCVGVDLAPALAAGPGMLSALLHPEERPLAQGMRGARLVEFVGGRIAARLARARLPGADRPTLRGPGGMPLATAGISLSISHTRCLAVALAHAGPGTVGIDVELLCGNSGDVLLAERILSDAERCDDSPEGRIPVVQRLSLKEAAYKALWPIAGPVPLRRIAILRTGPGRHGIEVAVAGGYGVTAECRDVRGHVLSLARTG